MIRLETDTMETGACLQETSGKITREIAVKMQQLNSVKTQTCFWKWSAIGVDTPTPWQSNTFAGTDWCNSFIKQHPDPSVRKYEATLWDSKFLKSWVMY